MSKGGREQRFNLARFVLGYLEHEGCLIAPPEYGVHEVLLPDALASQLNVASYLRLAFEAGPDDDVLRLSVNHPLVEAISERLAQEAGDGQVYVNHVRLEKKGLFMVAAKTLAFANARLSARRDAAEQAALHHYLRFNFKATFVSDEKQEQIISIVLDVQGGHAVRETELLERLVSSETEPRFPHLEVARPRWRGAGDALATETVQALHYRAQAAAEVEMAGRLALLQARTQRFLELDQARIEEYYDSLEQDLKKRQARAATAGEERHSNIEAKIQALRTERSAKLADIRDRYQLRVELALINVLLIAQPKVLLAVDIGNRRVTTTRVAVWNPLDHRLELMACDVCGEPGNDLHLCTAGHLAHRGCMAPQCIECNREYCQLCSDQVQECAVCRQPVCRASLRLCADCGRGTCREHLQLCHAADGQPVSLKDLQGAPTPAVSTPAAPPRPEPKPGPKPPARGPERRSSPAVQRRQPVPPPAAPAVKAVRLDVEVYDNMPRIVAFVMRSTNLVLATRVIELTSEGIHIECQCEKSPCPESGWLFRPAGSNAIEEQVKAYLAKLRAEYYLPGKRTKYFHIGDQQDAARKSLVLPAIWRDEHLLAEARRGFDRRRG